jgi:hypothetical protein
MNVARETMARLFRDCMRPNWDLEDLLCEVSDLLETSEDLDEMVQEYTDYQTGKAEYLLEDR